MSLQVRVKRTQQLEAQLSLVNDENEILRRRICELQEQVQCEVQEDPKKYDLCQLKAMLSDQEYCTKDAASLLSAGACKSHLENKSECIGKASLHCKAQELQKYVHMASNACQANLVHLIWACQVEELDDRMECLINEIRCELDECPDLPVILRKHYNTILAPFE